MNDTTADKPVLQLVASKESKPVQPNSHIKALNLVFEHPSLTLHERSVVNFIINRTLKYGKEWERIPRRHFTDGVWNRSTGECVLGPTGLSRTRVNLLLADLKKRGIIEASGAKNSSQQRLRVGLRRLRVGLPEARGGPHNTSIISNHCKGNSAEPKLGVEEMKIQDLKRRAEEVNRKSPETQRMKYGKRGLDVSAFQHFWATAIAESFSRFPVPIAFTRKYASIFKKNSKDIACPLEFDVQVFATDIVEHWPYYRQELKWANIPNAPDITTVARLLKDFLIAYGSSNRAEYDDLIATDSRQNVKLLKLTGDLQRQVNESAPKLEQMERERRVVHKQLDAGFKVKKELREKDKQIERQRDELNDLRMRLLSAEEGKQNGF